MAIEVTGIRIGGLRFDPRKQQAVWQVPPSDLGQRFDVRVFFKWDREHRDAPIRAMVGYQRADGSLAASDGGSVVRSGNVDVSFVMEALQPVTLSLELNGSTVYREVFPVEAPLPQRFVTSAS